MNLIKSIIIFVLFISFILGELGRVYWFNQFEFTLLDFFVAIFVIHWFIYVLIFRKQIRIPKLLKPMLVFASAALVSLVLNFNNYTYNELVKSSLYLFRWLSYASIYFILVQFKNNEKIFNYLKISGIFIIIFGLVQFIFYSDLRNLYYLGWDEHLYRLFSVYLDPNFAGIILSQFLLLYLALLFINNKNTNKTYYIIIIVLILVAIIFTFSRTAYLITLFCVSLFLIITGHKKLIFYLFFFFSVILAISINFFKSEGTNLLRTSSISAREQSVRNAWNIFITNPLYGAGFNAYQYVQIKNNYLNNTRSVVNHAAFGVENSYLLILATTGIIGFFVYLYMVFKIFYFSISKIRTDNRYKIIHTAFFSGYIGILISAFFINSLFYSFIMFYIWVVIGIMENNELL